MDIPHSDIMRPGGRRGPLPRVPDARLTGHAPSCGCADCITEAALARLSPSRRAMSPQLLPRLRRILREAVVEAYREGREDEREGVVDLEDFVA